MGLDMDFYKDCPNGERQHLKYFRKHSDLNGLLQECFVQKNPDKNPDDFNCSDFEITEAEVSYVEDFMREKNLNEAHYTGFFWGASSRDDWDETAILFEEIKDILKDGGKVVYHPWW